jgi:hypothetical protein
MGPGLRISLELDLDEPVSGSARDGAGNEQRFSGWLELHAAIERLRQRALGEGKLPAQGRQSARAER